MNHIYKPIQDFLQLRKKILKAQSNSAIGFKVDIKTTSKEYDRAKQNAINTINFIFYNINRSINYKADKNYLKVKW